jgi:hypothetical protein
LLEPEFRASENRIGQMLALTYAKRDSGG